MGRYWDFYERSTPRPAKGGIKAQSKRGSFGESWWSRRWINVLESFHIGARLTRGRSYARQGQVLSIDVNPGIVKARVQGSRPTPYQVTVEVKPLSEAQWGKVGKALASQAVFAARLLAGEMPTEIEEVFKGVGVPLFPESLQEIETDCSCPDYSNPCKHIAAVYYLLGEEFDRDPFLIFKLRGLNRDRLTGILGTTTASRGAEPAAAEREPEPLPTGLDDYWRGAPLPDDLYGDVRMPPVDAPLLRQLGGFPFWRADTPILDALLPTYHRASAEGLSVFLGESAGSVVAKNET